jgi:hypothetical protein
MEHLLLNHLLALKGHQIQELKEENRVKSICPFLTTLTNSGGSIQDSTKEIYTTLGRTYQTI